MARRVHLPGRGHAAGAAMMMILLVVLVLLAIGGGGWGYSRYGVAGGLGPFGLLVVVMLALYFTGNLRG